MFTGIIKEIGLIKNLNKSGKVQKLDVESGAVYKTAGMGDSIAVNGVCLTLTDKKKNILSFDVMEETLRRTTLNGLKNNDLVNVEEAVRADGSFGGHFVTGHVDCVGRVHRGQRLFFMNGQYRKIGAVPFSDEFRIAIEVPKEFMHLVVEKGSVSLDGVSLTVGEVRDNIFNVYIIPHTLKATTLGLKKAGDMLNIEFDIIGKYCARLFEAGRASSRVTEGFLKEKGFS